VFHTFLPHLHSRYIYKKSVLIRVAKHLRHLRSIHSCQTYILFILKKSVLIRVAKHLRHLRSIHSCQTYILFILKKIRVNPRCVASASSAFHTFLPHLCSRAIHFFKNVNVFTFHMIYVSFNRQLNKKLKKIYLF